MKKLTFLLSAILVFAFSSCSSESDSESDLASQGNDEKSSTETVSNYSTTDTSSYTYAFSGSKYFSQKDGYSEVSVTSGSGSNTITNWLLSHDYTPYSVTGFEAEVYCNSNLKRAGIELFGSSGYSMYWFEVFGDGQFYIQKDTVTDSSSSWSDILKLSASESKIETDKYNKIKVRSTDSNNIEVYLNGNLVHTIKSDDISINLPGQVAFSFQTKTGTEYSTSTVGTARFKLNSIQTVK